MTSENKKLDMILKFIGKETMSNVELFINDVLLRNYITFTSEEEIDNLFNSYMAGFISNHSYDEIEKIRYYTGVDFNNINSILRGTWNYDKNGILTEEKKEESLRLADSLDNIMGTMPTLPTNIKTYRGVSLASFKDYGISSLSELTKLIGQYYFESGFTSTSLLRNKSFFNRKLEWHDDCNIEIEYLIPEECNDGLPLITDDLSYSKVQSKFLINKDSLSKVIDVIVSEDEKMAYLKVVFIPKKIWDKSYVDEIVKSK